VNGVRLHVRAEHGGVTMHPPYDVEHLHELFNQYEAAHVAGNQWAEGECLNQIADYLALRLSMDDARELGADLFGAGVG
jgi:hypothetical protein